MTGETAARLLERLSERELADLIFTLGEEPASRRIAREIGRRNREGQPVTTTAELRELVEKAVGPRRPGHIHPATRTFMRCGSRSTTKWGDWTGPWPRFPAD